MVISQTSMVAVMTMTPLHMKDHGQSDLSALVIAFHIVGMYGLAPLVGIAADRVGRVRVIEIGAVILGSGTVLSVLAGYHPVLIFAGLFLLGLGWSCGLIGGSTLLTESVPVADRVAVQGSADLVMGVCGALGAIASGLIKAELGFHVLANAASIAAAILLAAALTARRRAARLA
jgi:MFS family permease